MNIDKYTTKSQRVIRTMIAQTRQRGHQALEPICLLDALLYEGRDVAEYIVTKAGTYMHQIEQAVAQQLECPPHVSGGEPYLSNQMNQVLAQSEQIASDMSDQYIAVGYILLASSKVSSEARQLFLDVGLNHADVESAIRELCEGHKVNSTTSDQQYNTLGKYAINLYERAREGKLDPVVGRDEEICRVLQILSCRTKNNPILVGEPGIGKTAIAEGLAHRAVRGDVPENLKNKLIYSLDMGALIAGAKYQGEFEGRLKPVVNEVTASSGEVILFIDEIHTLVGADASQGAMDAADILKPTLTCGELRAIGVTTPDEYRKYSEKDKALGCRFQMVMVDEPDEMSSISILGGLKEHYENHHKVCIQDDTTLVAAQLSKRYITDRFLPDKAIDLVDEAVVRLRTQIDSMPEELDKLERRIKQLEIEREAIKREHDEPKLAALSKQIADLEEERNALVARWHGEKDLVNEAQQLKVEREQATIEADKAERLGDHGRTAEPRYGRLKEIDDQTTQINQKLAKQRASGIALITEEVTAEDIADIVTHWTGIPVSRTFMSERDRLFNLEDELHKCVIGQNEAITVIVDAVCRSRAGLQDPNRPISSFTFLGMTGVGKIEVARALAEYFFDDEHMMTRTDISEYQEKFSATRLIGASPGYISYDEGGQLIEVTRREPYSVALFDEIGKAHPDVSNLLLQVLDDGRSIDNKGYVVNFKDTITTVTSNLGSDLIRHNFKHIDEQNCEEVTERTEEEVKTLLKQTIRPEFVNRIDETIVLTSLTKAQITQIVRLQLDKMVRTLQENGVTLHYSDAAIDLLSERGYDLESGARPVKHIIQCLVLNEFPKAFLVGTVERTKPITLDVGTDGQPIFVG